MLKKLWMIIINRRADYLIKKMESLSLIAEKHCSEDKDCNICQMRVDISIFHYHIYCCTLYEKMKKYCSKYEKLKEKYGDEIKSF